MSHLALYREFRPKTFDEVIGQTQIVETLKNQIKTDSISHAYLFCGTRGTGKTSCAKIFAKAVNCLSPKDGSPCGNCEVCKKIQSNGNLDIIEIDAASNNRVDEIRDLREKVGYLPSVGKYKVYIIDEVHMLTDSAFNALLKTLEEPPSHIIFILATTEPEKLPATIVSRCMRFDFKLVSIENLTSLLESIFKKTGTRFEENALEVIAKAGNGSVRDTLSIAEICKAYANDNITYQSVVNCLGITDDEILCEIAEAIIKKDGGTIIEKIDKLYEDGKNLFVLLSDLCDLFKNVLTIKLAPNYDLNLPNNILENYKKVSAFADEKYLLDVLKVLSDSLSGIKLSGNDKIFLETALLSTFYNDNLEIEVLKQKVQSLEENLKSGVIFCKSDEKIQKNTPKTQVFERNNDFENNYTNENSDTKILFGKFISYAREQNEMLLLASLNDVKNVFYKDDEIIFECISQATKDVIDGKSEFVKNFLKENNVLSKFRTIIYVDEQVKKESELSTMLDGKLKIE